MFIVMFLHIKTKPTRIWKDPIRMPPEQSIISKQKKIQYPKEPIHTQPYTWYPYLNEVVKKYKKCKKYNKTLKYRQVLFYISIWHADKLFEKNTINKVVKLSENKERKYVINMLKIMLVLFCT